MTSPAASQNRISRQHSVFLARHHVASVNTDPMLSGKSKARVTRVAGILFHMQVVEEVRDGPSAHTCGIIAVSMARVRGRSSIREQWTLTFIQNRSERMFRFLTSSTNVYELW